MKFNTVFIALFIFLLANSAIARHSRHLKKHNKFLPTHGGVNYLPSTPKGATLTDHYGARSENSPYGP